MITIVLRSIKGTAGIEVCREFSDHELLWYLIVKKEEINTYMLSLYEAN